MTFLNRLERKIGWITVGQLPIYIVSAQALIYIWEMLNEGKIQPLMLDPAAIVHAGEYWRLLTFLFIVPVQNPIFAFFYLYLLYIYGTALEAEWGSFSFTLYYLSGAIGTIATTFLVSILFFPTAAGAFYLNVTIFLAFAAIHPNFVLHLFFIIPVKIKWLAWMTWIFLGFTFLTGSIVTKFVLLVSLVNYFLFFTQTHIQNIRSMIETYKHRQRFKNWRGE